MQDEELDRELKILERRIQMLLGENKNLKTELNHTKETVLNLKNEIKNHQESISDFQNQIKINKLANNMVVDAGETSKMRREIDGYIREIDKCIAHLVG